MLKYILIILVCCSCNPLPRQEEPKEHTIVITETFTIPNSGGETGWVFKDTKTQKEYIAIYRCGLVKLDR